MLSLLWVLGAGFPEESAKLGQSSQTNTLTTCSQDGCRDSGGTAPQTVTQRPDRVEDGVGPSVGNTTDPRLTPQTGGVLLGRA